jgi:hypothetical protein
MEPLPIHSPAQVNVVQFIVYPAIQIESHFPGPFVLHPPAQCESQIAEIEC